MAPDKPTNLIVSNITSRGAQISWIDPKNDEKYGLSLSLIKLKKEDFLIRKIFAENVNEYEIDDLTPFTTYKISVAAGNCFGFSEKTITSFLTSEEGV